MKRFIEGVGRSQAVLFPDRLDDWVAEDNPVRVIDALVDQLDLNLHLWLPEPYPVESAP